MGIAWAAFCTAGVDLGFLGDAFLRDEVAFWEPPSTCADFKLANVVPLEVAGEVSSSTKSASGSAAPPVSKSSAVSVVSNPFGRENNRHGNGRAENLPEVA